MLRIIPASLDDLKFCRDTQFCKKMCTAFGARTIRYFLSTYLIFEHSFTDVVVLPGTTAFAEVCSTFNLQYRSTIKMEFEHSRRCSSASTHCYIWKSVFNIQPKILTFMNYLSSNFENINFWLLIITASPDDKKFCRDSLFCEKMCTTFGAHTIRYFLST